MNVPGWQPLLDRIASEQDPIRRRNLEVVGRHVVEEVAGNLLALLATLVPEPKYTIWGPPTAWDRTDTTRCSWYQALVSSGRNRLDYVPHRVVVDEQTVVTEGDFHYAFAGSDSPRPGHRGG